MHNINFNYNYKFHKDRLNRSHFKQSEYKIKILKSIIKRANIPRYKRASLVILLDRYARYNSYTKSINRCILTGRSRGVYRFFKVNRHMLNSLASNGIFPGIIKSSW